MFDVYRYFVKLSNLTNVFSIGLKPPTSIVLTEQKFGSSRFPCDDASEPQLARLYRKYNIVPIQPPIWRSVVYTNLFAWVWGISHHQNMGKQQQTATSCFWLNLKLFKRNLFLYNKEVFLEHSVETMEWIIKSQVFFSKTTIKICWVRSGPTVAGAVTNRNWIISLGSLSMHHGDFFRLLREVIEVSYFSELMLCSSKCMNIQYIYIYVYIYTLAVQRPLKEL